MTTDPRYKPPNNNYNVWCPYCDYRLIDSMIARKRMGCHIAADHPEEVLFPKGKEPDDLDPLPVKGKNASIYNTKTTIPRI